LCSGQYVCPVWYEDWSVVEVKPIEKPIEKPVEAKKSEPTFEGPYAVQLKHLYGMGFTNLEINDYMITQSKGNLEKAISWLLDMSHKQAAKKK